MMILQGSTEIVSATKCVSVSVYLYRLRRVNRGESGRAVELEREPLSFFFYLFMNEVVFKQ